MDVSEGEGEGECGPGSAAGRQRQGGRGRGGATAAGAGGRRAGQDLGKVQTRVAKKTRRLNNSDKVLVAPAVTPVAGRTRRARGH